MQNDHEICIVSAGHIPSSREFAAEVRISGMLDPSDLFLITRISDTRYRMVGEYGDYIERLGAFIDVYPLDGVGSDEAEAMELFRESRSIQAKYCRVNAPLRLYGDEMAGNGSLKRFIKKLSTYIMKSPREYTSQIAALTRSKGYDNSTYVSCLVWHTYLTILPKAIFKETRYVRFEDMKAPAPGGYDEMLKAAYGDYMTPPPESEQVGHHFYSIIKK